MCAKQRANTFPSFVENLHTNLVHLSIHASRPCSEVVAVAATHPKIGKSDISVQTCDVKVCKHARSYLFVVITIPDSGGSLGGMSRWKRQTFLRSICIIERFSP